MIPSVNDNILRTSRISTGICVFCGIFFMCLGIGIYIKERFEQREYVETLCYVRTSRIESFLCNQQHFFICYYPVWEVEYHNNRKRNTTITEKRANVRASYSSAFNRKEKFQIGVTYPCWYKFRKFDQLQWYKPTALFGPILLIFGEIASILAILC